MDGGDHRDRQLLDAVEQLERLLHHLLDLRLGGKAGEFADIGADQEAGCLALISTRPLISPWMAAVLGPFDDLAKLFGGLRPIEFTLSPSRSMSAQAMPS